MPRRPSSHSSWFLATSVTALAVLMCDGCVPPPPNVAKVPASGLALRIHIFGSWAREVNDAFIAAHENTPAFRAVNAGGDGDVVLGLENDSPMCAPPTGLCSFRISYRVRNNAGDTVMSNTTAVTASSDHCANLCLQAVNNVVVKVLEDAATSIASPPVEDPAASKKDPKKAAASKGPPPICSVAAGPRLAAEEAEARAAQVEVLKRIGVLEQAEYDCLRKAYLSRL